MKVNLSLSVRKILNGVFLAFAAGLCAALLILLQTAVQSYVLGEHLIALAEANQTVFQTMQGLRRIRKSPNRRWRKAKTPPPWWPTGMPRHWTW